MAACAPHSGETGDEMGLCRPHGRGLRKAASVCVREGDGCCERVCRKVCFAIQAGVQGVCRKVHFNLCVGVREGVRDAVSMSTAMTILVCPMLGHVA